MPNALFERLRTICKAFNEGQIPHWEFYDELGGILSKQSRTMKLDETSDEFTQLLATSIELGAPK